LKNQRRNDKKDVRKAQQIPLSQTWENEFGARFITHSVTPPKLEDFAPLVPSSTEEDDRFMSSGSFASLAARLGPNEFTPIEFRQHVSAGSAPQSMSEEDALLEQYSRRASSLPAVEIDNMIHQAQIDLGSAPSKKKKQVKLRIAG
jgi:hypothetical protein